VAKKGRRNKAPLPPPLPPETRTIGQLVAETLQLYRRHFWRSLALGLGPSATAVGLLLTGGWWRLGFVLTGGALLMTASYLGGIVIAAERRPPATVLLTGLAVGYVVFLPAPFLYSAFVLPVVLWFGFVGLAVPAALLEGTGFRRSFRRGFALARADFVHASGSLATLVIVAFLTSTVLFVLLRGGGQIAASSAAFASLLVISPLLFLGAGLLYFDQAARLESGPRQRSRRSRDADLHHALDPDGPGRADAEGKPRPAARGQS
jgi:hypothetical protein